VENIKELEKISRIKSRATALLVYKASDSTGVPFLFGKVRIGKTFRKRKRCRA
jgi:hypothetical protein